MPPDMPAAKLRPVGPMTTTRPPVMYSQPWSPTPSTDRERAAVPDAEPLAGHAAEVGLAARGAVEHHVADQDVLLGHEGRLARGEDDELAAREALAEVVVGVSFERQRDAARHEGAEALPRRAREMDADGVVREPVRAVKARHFRAEDGAHRAVDVPDGQPDVHRLPALERLAAERHEGRHVEGFLEPVVLLDHPPDGDLGPDLRPVEDRGEVEAAGLPMAHGLCDVEQVRAADHLVHGAEAQSRHVLADLLRDEAEEGLDELRLAVELGPELRVLGRDADGAGVEMADPHHDAAHDDERRRREPVLFGAEQGGDDDVAPGLHLSVRLDDDPVAELVHDEHLLGLGEPELPRNSAVLDRGQGRRAGAAVVAGDQHHVRMGLGDAGRDGPDPDLGHQLDADPRPRVRVLQVVDQLGQVLDRVDVVVRGRRDEPHARRRVADLGDPGIDLVARAAGRPRRAWRPGPS